MTVSKVVVWNEKLHRHIFYRTESREVLFPALENPGFICE